MKRWWVRRSSKRRTETSTPRQVRDTDSRRQSPLNTQYLRSRTISSYTPAPGPDLSRLSAHELLSHRRRLVRVLLGCFAVIALLAFLLSQFTAGISKLSYAPATLSTPDETVIKQAVNDYYASRPLERFRFMLDEKNLGQYLASKIPEVSGVSSIGAAGLGSSRLALQMRTPVASWQIGAKTVYVDSTGQSFSQNYYAAPAVVIEDQSGASITNSSEIASGSMIQYIGRLVAALQSNGSGTVSKVILPDGMIRELDVYLQGRAYRVKVQLDRDVTSQAADVKTALGYIDAHGGAKEYVDVRVAGKAFYK